MNIFLNIDRDISNNSYANFLIIDKNAENVYYLIKWTSDSYTFKSSHKVGRDVNKDVVSWCVMQYI